MRDGAAARGSRLAAVVAAGLVAAGCTSPPLRVGATFDYPPFVSGTPQAPEGFDVRFVRDLAQAEGRDLVFVRTAWPTLVADLEADRFDLAVGGITVRPERALAARFSTPLVETAAVALVPDSSSARTLDDLDHAGVRVAVNAGGHLERVARARLPHAAIVALAGNERVPGEIAAGRADAVVSDEIEAPHWQRAHPGLRAIAGFSRDRKAWLVRAEQGALAARIDVLLAARERDGSLGRAREQELGAIASPRCAEPLAALVAAIDERLSLAPFVAAAKHTRGLAVTDAAQEARVLDAAQRAVAEAARAAGRAAPPATAVRELFAAQIALGSRWQRALLERPEALPSPAPDLETRVRPAIARASERVARALVALPDALDCNDVREALRTGLRAQPPAEDELDALTRAICGSTRERAPASGAALRQWRAASRSMRTALPPSMRQTASATSSNAG